MEGKLIGRKRYFGQIILLVALEKYHPQLYKDISKVKDND